MCKILRREEFSDAMNGADLNLKAVEKHEMYEFTSIYDGSEIWKCFKQDLLLTFTHLNWIRT